MECNECGAEIELKDPVLREIVTCRDCGAEFEVCSLSPLALERAELEGEDWGE